MKTRVAATATFVFLLFSVGILISCNKSKPPQQAQSGHQAATAEERVERNPDRNAYFGDSVVPLGIDECAIQYLLRIWR